MVEYGVPVGEASTTVARSKLLGGGALCDRIVPRSSWAPFSLAHWLQRLASFAGSTGTCP